MTTTVRGKPVDRRDPEPLTRLSIGDLMTFWAEQPGAPLHIALAGVLVPGRDLGTGCEPARSTM